MRKTLSIIITLISIFQLQSQTLQYEVSLAPITIAGLGGLQSYVVGTYQGEWLIFGGRLDGLHRRQPFASFSPDGNNEDIIVVNPVTKQVWKKSLAALPSKLKEQLSSTNMEFYQNDNRLIITGGYGYSPSMDEHITYPFLTVVDIPEVIQDVKNGVVSINDFQQIEDATFQVAGGRLAQIGEVYFLVGGHKFIGRYNPMGPTHGPGFEQEYTNEIRKFTLNFQNGLDADILTPIHDEMHLHRRDYNLSPIISEGEYSIMVYSGVFQKNADLPWLYPVHITKDGYEPKEDFTQYFNHYHCATLPIYDASENEMHTLFFGGIAQFYMDGDLLVQDNDVPFVNTITDISRSKNGDLQEKTLDTAMPGYLGAGSEFILSPEATIYAKGMLSSEFIEDEFVDVGYIFGGIRSSLPNIFWINEGTESEASNTIFKVSIRNKKTSYSSQQEITNEKLFFYPNPAQKFVRMSIELDKPMDVLVDIYDVNGVKIHNQKIPQANVQAGKNNVVLDNVNIGFGAFIYKVTFGENKLTRKVIWTE